MRIRVLAFATAADALGGDEHELELPPASTVGGLRAALEARAPALVPLASRLAIAVNGEIAAADHALADGDEVALLPPVSGGAPPPVALVDDPIDVAALTAAVAGPDCGALVVFVGTVRDHDGGRDVAGIAYHGYRPMAEARLARIAAELAARDPGLRVGIVHRLGALAVGEASVAIVTAAPHRDLAYRASREALERLKAEVPIWKRERYADGEARWREEEPLVVAAAPARRDG